MPRPCSQVAVYDESGPVAKRTGALTTAHASDHGDLLVEVADAQA
jgi:hypothetical protein